MSTYRSFYAGGNIRIYYNIYSCLKEFRCHFRRSVQNSMFWPHCVSDPNECHDYRTGLLLNVDVKKATGKFRTCLCFIRNIILIVSLKSFRVFVLCPGKLGKLSIAAFRLFRMLCYNIWPWKFLSGINNTMWQYTAIK